MKPNMDARLARRSAPYLGCVLACVAGLPSAGWAAAMSADQLAAVNQVLVPAWQRDINSWEYPELMAVEWENEWVTAAELDIPEYQLPSGAPLDIKYLERITRFSINSAAAPGEFRYSVRSFHGTGTEAEAKLGRDLAKAQACAQKLAAPGAKPVSFTIDVRQADAKSFEMELVGMPGTPLEGMRMILTDVAEDFMGRPSRLKSGRFFSRGAVRRALAGLSLFVNAALNPDEKFEIYMLGTYVYPSTPREVYPLQEEFENAC